MPIIFGKTLEGKTITLNVQDCDTIDFGTTSGLEGAELQEVFVQQGVSWMVRMLEARGKKVIGKRSLKPAEIAPVLMKLWTKPITDATKLKPPPIIRKKKETNEQEEVQSDGSDIIRVRPKAKGKSKAKAKASSSSSAVVEPVVQKHQDEDDDDAEEEEESAGEQEEDEEEELAIRAAFEAQKKIEETKQKKIQNTPQPQKTKGKRTTDLIFDESAAADSSS